MNSETHQYQFKNIGEIEQIIQWINREYSFLCLTSGNEHQYPQGTFPNQILAGNTAIEADELWTSKGQNIAGIISYDFKNQLENLQSENPAWINVPDLTFFKSEIKIRWESDSIFSTVEIPESVWKEKVALSQSEKVTISPLTSRESYLENFKKVQNEIIEGNTYEMNYCISFEGKTSHFDPILAFFDLMKLSPMPFSALFKAKSKYLISASPERFLKKSGNQLIAQPIKGTAKRGHTNDEDERNKSNLLHSEKEQAENLMITDLMRNDLSKVSETGSVNVPELFGIYSFPKVHQMITTVSSQLKTNTTFREIIEATFPMGSMTGAPKIKTMEIIDQIENFTRGWFSGTLMLIDENGDFDSSVIIRSIISDLEKNKLYFGVGSAITIDADPNAEYEECLLKASAILEVLSGK
ncbi:anthranilate synthase component I family protein [Algoriphagus zhangzhouensis]|uniref:Para-aminobenzoate synthetase component 1 n=1 Tax=Algoriphagus zhangzhouensis TaxID=1073327 RepID=A0A1M7ZCS1_9BACT|nr:anthranilate synthase component I family protein [Algoriphagus zhangzhouensis]TDY45639.1 para-aminobenzoate synthetase component 1 [Algoriphagus zhangzhouensis]SHO62677.1 para-aminobenzoate synthetase component 1 [Algoriphagus zhangzhouensis]